MSQTGFVSLLIRFHFFFLMIPLRLLGKPRLNFIAKQERSPGGVSASFTALQLFIGEAL